MAVSDLKGSLKIYCEGLRPSTERCERTLPLLGNYNLNKHLLVNGILFFISSHRHTRKGSLQ